MNYTKINKNNSLSNNNIFSGVALSMVFLFLLSLGTWQVERLHWKNRLLIQIEESINADPLKVPVIDNSLVEFNYRNVFAEGHFLPKLTINLEPRTYKGVAGVNILTPFYSEKKYILVNRGFVSYEDINSFSKSDKNISTNELFSIKGIARLYTKKNWSIPNNNLKEGKFFFPNIEDISEYLGLKLEPYILEMTKDEGDKDYPISNVTIIDIPNNHLQYAITWFGLALSLSIITILSYKSDRPKSF